MIDADVLELMDRLFSEYAEAPQATTDIEQSQLWLSLRELGLAQLTTPERCGGSGAGWLEAAALISTAARHGVTSPLVEHDLLAGWLLDAAGLPVTPDLHTVVTLPATADAGGPVTAYDVPWGRAARSIAVLSRRGAAWGVSEFPRAEAALVCGENIAGEPRDVVTLSLGDRPWTPVEADIPEMLLLRGGLARAIQISGALQGIGHLCRDHVLTREQFGRRLSEFQAVQHLLADCAADTWLAMTAADAAVARVEATGWTSSAFAVAVARSCAAQAVDKVVRIGHQLHGAIGTTAEHRLHRLTLPALAWRSEFGTVVEWEQRLASAVQHAGRGGLWDLMSS